MQRNMQKDNNAVVSIAAAESLHTSTQLYSPNKLSLQGQTPEEDANIMQTAYEHLNCNSQKNFKPSQTAQTDAEKIDTDVAQQQVQATETR